MTQIKVLHIITGLHTGGAEAMLVKLIQQGIEAGRATPFVISLTKGGKNKARLERIGIPVYELNLKQFWLLPFKLLSVVRLIKKHEINVINAWMYHAMLFSVFLQFFFFKKLKIIWNVRHSLQNIYHEKRSLRWLIRALSYFVTWCSCIVFNSNKSALEHGKYWHILDRAKFIPNGFELNKLAPISKNEKKRHLQELGIDSGFVIGHVGRLHPMKNHRAMLSAFEEVKAQYDSLHLVMVGKGTETLELGSGVSNVHLLGEHTQIEALIREFDLFILSSAWGEGFPNVLGEAMGCGLPCITTDVGDSAFLLGDNTWVVESRNHEALVKAMANMINLDASERGEIGKMNRSRVMKEFSIKEIEKVFFGLYVDCVQ